MKLPFVKNPEAQVREDEHARVNEITAPVQFSASRIILVAFLLLPLIYLVIMEQPSKMTDKAVPASNSASPEQPKEEVTARNSLVSLEAAKEKAARDSSFDSFFQLAFEYYKAGMFMDAVNAGEKAVAINPNSETAYNNICSAYNELKMYDKAIEACNKALAVKPDFQLARNNLKWAEEKLKETAK